ncbi:hypothetical protein CRE_16512 [Caenorhabditis remanei]|uniref:Uncharacterized protein n=1 Tax=Caenorhabditis remanei TaxID=31234 RepID=E3NN47_CAERE|nr:hypothetical protein CRE_16512 [Caenorhabditis remanei]
MAIVTALLPVPLSVYVFAFAVIFFPRLVLTRHFWSDEQRREFFQLEVTKALISGEQLLSTLGSNCYIRKIDIGKKNESEMRDSLRQYVKFTSRMPNNVYLYASPLFKQK